MSSNIHQRIYVKCASSQAKSQLEDYLAHNADESGVMRFALRVPLALPALDSEVELKRDVVATIAPAKPSQGAILTRTVRWEPAGGGPFPRFEGTLDAEYDESYDSFILVLDGSYSPPLGLAGATFDAALGHRIAVASARTLLREIAAALELGFRRTEAAKELDRERTINS